MAGLGDVVGSDRENNGGNSSPPNRNPANDPTLEYLKSIDDSLKTLLKNGAGFSQSQARQDIPRREDFQDRSRSRSSYGNASRKLYSGNPFDDFIDSFEDVLVRSIFGSDFQSKVQSIFSNFADVVGVEIQDIPSALGTELGKQAVSAFKGSKFGKSVSSSLGDLRDKVVGSVSDAFNKGVDDYYTSRGFDPEKAKDYVKRTRRDQSQGETGTGPQEARRPESSAKSASQSQASADRTASREDKGGRSKECRG